MRPPKRRIRTVGKLPTRSKPRELIVEEPEYIDRCTGCGKEFTSAQRRDQSDRRFTYVCCPEMNYVREPVQSSPVKTFTPKVGDTVRVRFTQPVGIGETLYRPNQEVDATSEAAREAIQQGWAVLVPATPSPQQWQCTTCCDLGVVMGGFVHDSQVAVPCPARGCVVRDTEAARARVRGVRYEACTECGDRGFREWPNGTRVNCGLCNNDPAEVGTGTDVVDDGWG